MLNVQCAPHKCHLKLVRTHRNIGRRRQLSAFGKLCNHGIGMYYDALLLFFRVARHSELVWLVGSNFKTLFFFKSGNKISVENINCQPPYNTVISHRHNDGRANFINYKL
jgi:hypothetical protein